MNLCMELLVLFLKLLECGVSIVHLLVDGYNAKDGCAENE